MNGLYDDKNNITLSILKKTFGKKEKINQTQHKNKYSHLNLQTNIRNQSIQFRNSHDQYRFNR